MLVDSRLFCIIDVRCVLWNSLKNSFSSKFASRHVQLDGGVGEIDYLPERKNANLIAEYESMSRILLSGSRVVTPHLISGLRGCVSANIPYDFAKIFHLWWSQYRSRLNRQFPNQICNVVQMLGKTNALCDGYLRQHNILKLADINSMQISFVTSPYQTNFLPLNLINFYHGLYHLYSDNDKGIHPVPEFVSKTLNILEANCDDQVQRRHATFLYAEIFKFLYFIRYDSFTPEQRDRLMTSFSRIIDELSSVKCFTSVNDLHYTVSALYYVSLMRRFWHVTAVISGFQGDRSFWLNWLNALKNLTEFISSSEFDVLPVTDEATFNKKKNLTQSLPTNFIKLLACSLEIMQIDTEFAVTFDKVKPILDKILPEIVRRSAPNAVEYFYQTSITFEQKMFASSVSCSFTDFPLLTDPLFEEILKKLTKFNQNSTQDLLVERKRHKLKMPLK